MSEHAASASAPELLIARFRGHARRLFWSGLLLIATAGAVGFFSNNLPADLENWMLWSAGGVIVLLGVIIPFIVWSSRRYTITTRRVIEHSGLGARNRIELSHSRGYTIAVRRGVLQRLWGAGTITLSDGRESVLRLKNVPRVALVHETLADQIEIAAVLAHRDSAFEGETEVF